MKTNNSSSHPVSPSELPPTPPMDIEEKESSPGLQSSSSPYERATALSPKSFFRSKSIWPVAILAMVAVVLGVGSRTYQSLTQESAIAEQEIPPARLPVQVARVGVGLSQKWVFDEGFVRAVRQRVLNFEANGDIEFIAKVDGRDLRAGDRVQQGQLLASIDDRKQISSIDTDKADVEVSVQTFNQAEASLLQAKADFDKAQSDLRLAKAEMERYRGLFEDGAVSESSYDVYVNSEEQARAALKVAEQGIRSAEDGVISAQASIDAAQARLRQSNVNLEDTQLVSPIDGIVAYINIREGEYWSAQRFNSNLAQDVVEAAPIVVVNPGSFEVELELQADEAQQIRPGQRAYVVLEEDVSAAEAAGVTNGNLLEIAKQQGSRGQVFSVSPTQTPGGRGVEVSIRDFQLVRNLRVGGRVYVWIEAAVNPNAVTVPLGALLPGKQTVYAFVVDESSGMVERRTVETGIEGLTGVEILSGVEPGELVVTEGINRLVDGTVVEIVAEEARR
ncbi:MAG: HlyD family efflux transporter periplasmic adaptor subunit [Cyanobacteria bacterium P01_F01_bin.150]